MVVRIYVLLDKTFVFEEGWQQIPFVLRSVYWGVGSLLIVERLQCGREVVILFGPRRLVDRCGFVCVGGCVWLGQ